MKVFKFGGASVKDADSVRNVSAVMNRFPNEQIIVVVSAMGKITNALEKLADSFFYNKSEKNLILEEIKKYHLDIIRNLFSDPSQEIYKDVQGIFSELENNISKNPSGSYNREYDQIVSLGEIISVTHQRKWNSGHTGIHRKNC